MLLAVCLGDFYLYHASHTSLSNSCDLAAAVASASAALASASAAVTLAAFAMFRCRNAFATARS